MASVSSNMFRVENFLCFFNLRGGTLFSLYATFIFGLISVLWALHEVNELLKDNEAKEVSNNGRTKFYENKQDSTDSRHGVTPFLLTVALFISTSLVSGIALLFFPEMNKKYDKNSIYAKCIKYFFTLCSAWVIITFLGLFAVVLDSSNRIHLDSRISITLGFVFFIGVFTHFAAVAYSFYLSILEPENHPGEKGLTNTTFPLDGKNDTKIDLQPLDSSTNGSGNLYVELR